MEIKTKHDIGEMVEFVRQQETVGGKPILHQPEIGIIEKILISDNGISYLLKSSYQNWIKEEEITNSLVRK